MGLMMVDSVCRGNYWEWSVWISTQLVHILHSSNKVK